MTPTNKRSRVQELASKWRDGRISDNERIEFNQWYNSFDDVLLDVESVETPEQLKMRIYGVIVDRERFNRRNKEVKLWQRIAVAAAILLVVGTVFLFYMYLSPFSSDHSSLIVKDAAHLKPGKNTATLTLANGKVINLSDTKTGVVIGNDKLVYNDGSTVANLSPSGRDGLAREGSNNNNALSPQGGSLQEGERSKVQMLTASTPRGGTYQILLSDGTRVWLNAASTLKFPADFNGKTRRIVELSGEGYFEVAKSNKKLKVSSGRTLTEKIPFIVYTSAHGNIPAQQVEVLGTHFNINSYEDEEGVKTTLSEGKVRVSVLSNSGNINNDRSQILDPGLQAILNAKDIAVKEVNIEKELAWKNGYIRFDDLQIKEIMRVISRWYDVDVMYQGTMPTVEFTGSITKYKNLGQILKMLESTGKVHFKVEGRRVTVSK